MWFFLIVVLLIIVYFGFEIISYNKTTYKEVTHNSYFKTRFDTGRNGEYDTYCYLRPFESVGYKFLFNVYLPKKDGKTTELDVLMIGEEAVYVFESKNYSGWIFGNDTQRTWTQVLPKGRGRSQKEKFYNPVWQNKTHCETLKAFLPQGAAIKSVVLFSNRCTFKDVTVTSKDVAVVHRRDVRRVVEQMPKTVTQPLDIELIYEKLYPFSQVSEEVKRSHVDDINNVFGR